MSVLDSKITILLTQLGIQQMKQTLWWTKCKKICAVLKNYELHAKEMRGSVPSKPTFFLKPSTSFLPTLPDNVTFIEVPPGVDLHHEGTYFFLLLQNFFNYFKVELGVVIGKRAKNVSEADAMKHVAGYVLALDMTARNLQNEAKAAGMPWTISKGYDTFCPIDADHFFPASQITDPHNLVILVTTT